jgi:hypothetical protein
MSELWSRPLPLALLALGLLALLVWWPRRTTASRSWALFRCLLPTWRFFEQLDAVPALRYRVAPSGEDWREWQDALRPPPRTMSSLLLNAAGNLHLASESLIQHLVADLEEASGLGRSEYELISYRLVCALVEQRVRATFGSSATLRFQFSLADSEPADGATLLFVSRVHGTT